MPRNTSTLSPSLPIEITPGDGDERDDASLKAIESHSVHAHFVVDDEGETRGKRKPMVQTMAQNRVSFQQLGSDEECVSSGSVNNEQKPLLRQSSYGSISPKLSPRGTRHNSVRASTRASAVQRMSAKIATRLSHRGATTLDRHGTVASVTINTLCNIIGA